MKPVTSKIFFVFALLVLSVESQDDYDTCNLDKTVEENTVIQLKASKMNGAEFLGSTFPDTLEECFTTCCSDPSYPTCTVAVFNYDKEKEIQSCSLIQCDPLDQCVFSTMDNFTTVTMVRTTLTDETSTANTSEGEEHIGATEVEEVGGVSDGDYDDTTVQPHITTKPTFTTQKTATEKEETQTENEGKVTNSTGRGRISTTPTTHTIGVGKTESTVLSKHTDAAAISTTVKKASTQSVPVTQHAGTEKASTQALPVTQHAETEKASTHVPTQAVPVTQHAETTAVIGGGSTAKKTTIAMEHDKTTLNHESSTHSSSKLISSLQSTVRTSTQSVKTTVKSTTTGVNKLPTQATSEALPTSTLKTNSVKVSILSVTQSVTPPVIKKTTASESTEEGNEETTSGDESTKPSEATEKPENKEPTDAPYYTTLGFDEQTDANVANLTNFDHKLYDQTSTGALVAAMCFGILFLFAVMVLLGKRAYESYQRRHYSKMDYLINGMYN